MDLDQIIRLVVLFFAIVYFMRKPASKKEPAPIKKRELEIPLKREVALKISPVKEAPILVKKEQKHSRPSLEEHQFQTSIEQRKFETNLDSRYSDPYGKRVATLDLGSQAHAPSYGVIGQSGNSKANLLLSRLRSKKEMVVLQEIINPPKSMRKDFPY